MRKITLATLLVLTFALSACIVTVPIQTPYEDISAYSLEENVVQKSIVEACVARGWTIEEKTDSNVKASILVRGKHKILVNIPYTSNTFKIEYLSSANMDAKADGTIHPNYNKWVETLAADIKRKLSVQ